MYLYPGGFVRFSIGRLVRSVGLLLISVPISGPPSSGALFRRFISRFFPSSPPAAIDNIIYFSLKVLLASCVVLWISPCFAYKFAGNNRVQMHALSCLSTFDKRHKSAHSPKPEWQTLRQDGSLSFYCILLKLVVCAPRAAALLRTPAVHAPSRSENGASIEASTVSTSIQSQVNEMENNAHNGLPKLMECRACSLFFSIGSKRKTLRRKLLPTNASIWMHYNIIIEFGMCTQCACHAIQSSKCACQAFGDNRQIDGDRLRRM